MSRMIDITGKRFGRLVAIEPSKDKATNESKKWLCECDCGTKKYIRSSDLRFGKVTSCGCWKDEKTRNRFKVHGKSNTLQYEIWKSMKQRCYNSNNKDYPNYGGRGIKVCDEWKDDFLTFYHWAKYNGYKRHYTIERINPSGNYEPSNCTWIPNEQQALNRKTTRVIEYQGNNYSMREISEKFNVNYNTFRDYINKGKTPEEIINHFN